MTKLKTKVEHALSESRTLILGAQVLLGFQFRSVFETSFDRLSLGTQYLKVAGLALMLVALALLILPAARHSIVEAGKDTPGFHRFTTRTLEWALAPFALGLGVDLYVAGAKVLGQMAGAILGAAGLVVALFFWYGWEMLDRHTHGPHGEEEQAMADHEREAAQNGTKLEEKIKHVLTETRMVLPGTQALLGFQLAVMLMEGFDKLPATSKYIHLASLMCVGLSAIVLMTPAAYHRIVEQGEDTEHFHRFASRMLLAALVPLTFGMVGDFYIVVRKLTDSTGDALIAAAVTLILYAGLWFGLPLVQREQHKQAPSYERGLRKTS